MRELLTLQDVLVLSQFRHQAPGGIFLLTANPIFTPPHFISELWPLLEVLAMLMVPSDVSKSHCQSPH